MWTRLLTLTLSLVAVALAIPSRAADPVSFQSQVRPLLAKHCFTCHGPDEAAREAGLRLDTRDGAVEDRGGYQPVVPGDAEASELVARITTADTDLRMPPVDAGSGLSPGEIEVLVQWVNQGAEYESHWAFSPPQRPSIPAPSTLDSWSLGPIDRLIYAKSLVTGTVPNPAADRHTLIRRVFLDVTGLPPTAEQADRFAADDSPMAYAKMVDRLLADPYRAERMARGWLDLARYADTNGYEKDRPRSIWPYRDWVIDAFAADMPYDRFTIDQLAGDMLDAPTREAQVATGFNRNTMLNEEGGIDPLEFRFQAMVDRVATVGTVWMGLTTGCAQCHTHKYDPITHTDFYAMMALLNNADEPEIRVVDASLAGDIEQHRNEVRRAEQALIEQHSDVYACWLQQQVSSARPWTAPQPTEMHSTLPRLRLQQDGSIYADGDATKRDEYQIVYGDGTDRPITAIMIEVLPDSRLPAEGPGRSYYEGRRGDFFLSELTLHAGDRRVELSDASHSHGSLSIGSGTAAANNVIDGDGSTGWSTSNQPGKANWWVANFDRPIAAGTPLTVDMLFERHFAASLGRFRIWFTASDDTVVASLIPPAAQQSLVGDQPLDRLEQQHVDAVASRFLRESELMAGRRGSLDRLDAAAPDPPTTLVMRERPRDNIRPTYRHHRGEYLNPREPVEPAIPKFLRGATSDDSATGNPRNRLQFAQWLVSSENPLVARVAMNRIWRDFFGAGLVRTAGDFGTQSEPPTYPDVLDLLAVDFADSGWSLARSQRQILLSATYRQSSETDPQGYARDPENRLLHRGPRFRMPAEMVRDVMVASSGALSSNVGGPSVYPPQDASVTKMAYGEPDWKVSEGADRYRRSLYTFAKRTAPFAAYTVFDGPTGETCLARRERSNTPLQALTLMNDPMYVELAKLAASDVLQTFGDDATDREIATAIFRRLLVREPTDREIQSMLHFVATVSEDFPSAETGSVDRWTLLARALMNLDEAITKE
jgi:hypothetical protein